MLALAFTRLSTPRAVDLYLLALGVIALFSLLAATSAAARTEDAWLGFDASLRPALEAEATPHELDRIDREVFLAEQSVFYLYFRLRPLLRDVARHRLRSRRGIELDGRPEMARAALGERTWALLRPDAPPPKNRDARGLPLTELRAIVDSIERI